MTVQFYNTEADYDYENKIFDDPDTANFYLIRGLRKILKPAIHSSCLADNTFCISVHGYYELILQQSDNVFQLPGCRWRQNQTYMI